MLISDSLKIDLISPILIFRLYVIYYFTKSLFDIFFSPFSNSSKLRITNCICYF